VTGGRRAEIAVGLSMVLSYVFHAGRYVLLRQAEDGLWFCHLAALAIGTALLVRSPLLNAIGLLWLTVGIPSWALYLASGGRLLAGAVLTHVGGAAAGLFGVRRLGLPPGAWWKALLALVAVHFLTRLVTPPPANVNLAFAVWRGWEDRFPSHSLYLLLLTGASALWFFCATQALRRSGLVRG
jgi:hypothetical protein